MVMTNDIAVQSWWKEKSVLVSGAGGFIGHHMVDALIEAGANVVGLYHNTEPSFTFGSSANERLTLQKIDLSKPQSLAEVSDMASGHFDVLIHCAGLDGNTQYKLEHAAEIMDMNTRMALDVLNLAHEENITDVVLLSSAEIYTTGQSGQITEEDDYRKYSAYTTNGYVLSKIFAEISAELYSKQYGINVYLPRLGNVYGPGDHFGELPTRVIPSMIHKLSTGQQIDIWGDGKQTRQFIYVKDAVRAVLETVQHGNQGPINIATKQSISILNLANMLAEICGVHEGRVNVDLSKPSGATDRELVTDEMYGLIDFSPIALEAGLKETVDWYKASKLKT
jgi:nucleoside-diphosphate-sugar epimerase